MVNSEVIITTVIAFNVLLLALLFSSMFFRVRRSPEKATASFQLHPDAAELEFKILTLVRPFTAASLILAGIGDLLGVVQLTASGLLMVAIFGIIDIWIFYRWWRRF